MRTPAGIFFDLDGTLMDSMPFHETAWRSALQEEGIEITSADVYASEGEKSETFAERMFLREKGRAPSVHELARCLENKETAFRRVFSVRPMPGTMDVLKKLHALNTPLALVSGSRRIQERYSELAGFLDFFRTIVSGDDVTFGKPNPQPFRLAAERLRLPAEDCLVIENAPLGIQAAKAAGMQCWAVQNGSPLTEFEFLKHGADRAFPQLVDLLRIDLR